MITALLVGLTAVNHAQLAPGDVPQWRGANRDGIIAGFTEPAAWPGAAQPALENRGRSWVRHAACGGQPGVPVLATG